MDYPRRIQELEAVLEECRDKFSFYAESHRKKNTPDALEKAEVNEMMVQKIEDVLVPF